MTPAARAYEEHLRALLAQRRRSPGGRLPQDVESRWVEELDRLWWALTASEQDELGHLWLEAIERAPLDDEPYTDEQRAADDEARKEATARGVLTTAELRRRLGL